MIDDPYLVVVAGGKGLRMGSEIPKQFLLLQGKPIVMHTIDRFVDALSNLNVILVLPKDQMDYWNRLVVEHQFTTPVMIAEGGSTRFHSVKNGLSLVNGNGVVGIHDAVRPLVSKSAILRCYQTADEKGNATPVIAVSDSMRVIRGAQNERVDRALYRRIQTPQVFKTELIQQAFDQEYNESFTDDASVIEALGYEVYLVEGNEENIKLTQPADLIMAEAILEAGNL